MSTIGDTTTDLHTFFTPPPAIVVAKTETTEGVDSNNNRGSQFRKQVMAVRKRKLARANLRNIMARAGLDKYEEPEAPLGCSHEGSIPQLNNNDVQTV